LNDEQSATEPAFFAPMQFAEVWLQMASQGRIVEPPLRTDNETPLNDAAATSPLTCAAPPMSRSPLAVRFPAVSIEAPAAPDARDVFRLQRARGICAAEPERVGRDIFRLQIARGIRAAELERVGGLVGRLQVPRGIHAAELHCVRGRAGSQLIGRRQGAAQLA